MVHELRLAWDDDEFIRAGGARLSPRSLGWDDQSDELEELDEPPNTPRDLPEKSSPAANRVRRSGNRPTVARPEPQ